MKKIFLMFFLSVMLTNIGFSQCTNADFSTGTFTGWTGSVGENQSGVYSVTGTSMVVGDSNTITYAAGTGRQTLMTQSAYDPIVGGTSLNVLPPNAATGAKSCRIGNARAAGCDGGEPQAERIEYSYTVTPESRIFTYQYAVVLQDPGTSHTSIEKPKFTIYVTDANGTIVDQTCGVYEVTASSSIPGFTPVAPSGSTCRTTNIMWKNWTTVSMDLKAFLNQTVKIQFTTYDCDPFTNGGHFGYAYISCYCGSLSLVQQCAGSSDIVTAPAGFVSYQWSYVNTSGTPVNTTTTTNTITVNPVPNGQTITCVMTSVTGCTVTLTLPLSIELPVFTPTSPTICAGETANITATGNGNYTYQWSNSSIGPNISVSPTTTTTYSVTATSDLGCTSSNTVIVNVNPLPTANISSNPATCASNDGSLTATPVIGTFPFTYSWNTSPVQTTQTASNLYAGQTYTVTIKDANNCSSTFSGTVPQQGSLAATTTSTVEYCGHCNGSATVTPSGGTEPYTYLWSSNAASQTTSTAINLCDDTYSVTVTDANQCSTVTTAIVTTVNGPITSASNTPEYCDQSNGTATANPSGGSPSYTYSWSNGGTSQTINGLAAGTYSVTITDSHNCSTTTSTTITEIAGPTATATSTAEHCDKHDGTATTSINGGTPNYTYHWNNGQSNITATGLAQGTYTVTVSDSHGCTTTTTVDVTEIAGPTATATSTIEHCDKHDGSVTANPVGGTSPYTYHWNDGHTTKVVSNIAAGTYIVTVSDNFGCTITTSVVVDEVQGPAATATSTVEYCRQCNGTATVNPTAGTPPYNYIWSNGQSSKTVTQLCATTYTVTVNDVNFCSATTNVLVNSIDGPTITSLSMTEDTCGHCNGTATVNVNGGTLPYTYAWNTTPVQTTATATGLCTNPYTVIVTDDHLCKDTGMVNVGFIPGPTLTIQSTPDTCFQGNGTTTVLATGGTSGNSGYTYVWSSNTSSQTTATATGLSSGNYIVTVTDAGNCVETASVSVDNTGDVNISLFAYPKVLTLMDGLPVNCVGSSADDISIWDWNFGDGTTYNGVPSEEHLYSSLGTFPITLIGTGKNGCRDTAYESVEVRDIFTFYIPNAFSPNGDGINDFFFPQGVNVDPDNFDMWIFNRWGNMIYHTDVWYEDTYKCEGWNGTEDNRGTWDDSIIDVYVYKIKVREIFGKKYVYYGKIVLIK